MPENTYEHDTIGRTDPPRSLEALADATVDRRLFLRGSALAGAGLVAASVLPAGIAHAAPACYFGAGVQPRGGEANQRDAVLALESKIGRKLGIHRRYVHWDGTIPDGTHRWASDGGRIPYISFHAYKRSGANISWRSIASGQHDAHLRSVGSKLRDFGAPIYFSFHHEPEDDGGNGTAADFRAAFDRVKGVFDSQGATNLRWMVALMASTYGGGNGGLTQWLPSSSSYSLLGADGYNRYPISKVWPWRTFAEVFSAARTKAQQSGKGLFIAEYGCVENNAGDKGRWFDQASATMSSWPELKAAVYSHRQDPIPYWVDSSSSSLAAFKAMGLRSHFNG